MFMKKIIDKNNTWSTTKGLEKDTKGVPCIIMDKN